jgi:hypothetical protein
MMTTNSNQVLHSKSRKNSAQKKLITILFVLVLPLASCGGGNQVDESLIRTQVALEGQQTALSEGLTSAAPASVPQQPQATEALSDLEPTAPVEAPTVNSTTPPEATATTGPRCTVLQDLNFRTGPGTAYNPPISTFQANMEVIPIAYQPVGIPGGSWVQVENPANQQKGWVSAGSQYVSCNIDLTTLPQVTVAPPPTPIPPRAQTSNQDGTCGAGGNFDGDGNEWDCAVAFSGGFPIGFVIYKNGEEVGRGAGIQNVVFRVEQGGSEVYRRRENDAAYCMFGGDGPCNLWILENYVYKWESGGTPIEPGRYKVNIDANMDNVSVTLHWNATVTIE